ncbi:imidazole glycerol phosphate synthase cyclase subunit [Thalassospira sp. GO-4]|jgi:cyclase|uniref:imidazole glycerol phosphate synthase subunit HisF n=1 Tax=Thalassospira sp. GO-4 TaxID=2946605 RepID=UPI0020252DDE|nr:imidazole glycerol phosphate synthase cyclase subunit [Thalassospira sp. GO-4]URK17329.1 imidazole glycerol phosphate synthase cyclase subunit [Thalassospira sp. GO-4]
MENGRQQLGIKAQSQLVARSHLNSIDKEPQMIRIIPRLDIKGPNLVKGVNLEGLRVLGKPEAFAAHYYAQGADELIYMDMVASLYNRNHLSDIVRKTAEEALIPLTVGGGIRSLNDIREVLRAGADKVIINTAAIENPDIIRQAAQRFGSSTVVASLEVIDLGDGNYECLTHCGREVTGVEPVSWAKELEELGAGEICLTAIAMEGTGNGFDIDLVNRIATSVAIPVIAHGGAGTSEDVLSVIRDGAADAVCIASMFHYEAIDSIDWSKEDYSAEGNTEFVKSRRKFHHFDAIGIKELKHYLGANKIMVRSI